MFPSSLITVSRYLWLESVGNVCCETKSQHLKNSWRNHQLRARRALMLFKMFCWEPEGHYRHRLCTVIAPFWFSAEQLWTALMPFWLSTDEIIVHRGQWKYLSLQQFYAVDNCAVADPGGGGQQARAPLKLDQLWFVITCFVSECLKIGLR